MNIIDVQDQLKNFSEQQLVSEMQAPTGSAPQFLVLGEIKRRKRVRDDLSRRQAAQEPTVAEEAVAAAGVPQGGIMGMSEAMAPKSTMVQNAVGSTMPQAMRSGGLAQFGQELSGKVSEGVDPFLDEVEGMAEEKFGVDLGGPNSTSPLPVDMQGHRIAQSIAPDSGFMRMRPFQPFNDMRGYIGPSPLRSAGDRASLFRRGGKGGAIAYNEGGVIKAANGIPLGLRQNNPGNIRPGAGFYGESGEGGGYATFGTEDEGLRALARLLGTYSDKYDINTLRGLTSRYAPRSDNKESFDNYLSYLGDTLGMDPDEEFDLKEARDDLIPAIVGFEQGRDYEDRYSGDQIARAISAASTEDEAEIASILNDPDRQITPTLTQAELDAASLQSDQEGGLFSALAATNNQSPQEIFDGMQKGKGGATFPSSLSELFAFGRDENVPVSERIGSRQDLQGQAAGEQQEYLQDTIADQITGESNEYQEYVRRSRLSGITPKSPSEYRKDFNRDFKNAEGLADSSSASRAFPFSSIEQQEASADAASLAASLAANQSMSGNTKTAAETIEAAKKEGENIFDESQRNAEQFGDRSKYEDSLRDVDNLETTPASKTSSSSTQSNTTVFGDTTTGSTGLSKEIQDLQNKLDKDKETDKYLALAQAGLALMSSKEPTLLGAVGEAGVSGLTAFREAQDRYQEGVVDLINARAKLKGKGSSFTANQMLQRAAALREQAANALSDEDKSRASFLADQLEQQAQGLMGSGVGLGKFNVASPGV